MSIENDDGVCLYSGKHPNTLPLWRRIKMFLFGYRISSAALMKAEYDTETRKMDFHESREAEGDV